MPAHHGAMDDKSDNGAGAGANKLAVALSHDLESEAAPRVTASGRGAVAEQILRVALEHGVEIRHDADLAEVLSTLEIDSEIPLEAFAAVAEILAYIYRANGQLPEQRNPTQAQPRDPGPQEPR